MIGAEDLVAGAQCERSRHDVEGDRHVLRIDDVFGAGAEVGGEGITAGFHQVVVTPAQKFHGLAFQFALPALVHPKDRFGCCPERAVVEKGHPGVEQELSPEGRPRAPRGSGLSLVAHSCVHRHHRPPFSMYFIIRHTRPVFRARYRQSKIPWSSPSS